MIQVRFYDQMYSKTPNKFQEAEPENPIIQHQIIEWMNAHPDGYVVIVNIRREK